MDVGEKIKRAMLAAALADKPNYQDELLDPVQELKDFCARWLGCKLVIESFKVKEDGSWDAQVFLGDDFMSYVNRSTELRARRQVCRTALQMLSATKIWKYLDPLKGDTSHFPENAKTPETKEAQES
jgi:hypothetical protein